MDRTSARDYNLTVPVLRRSKEVLRKHWSLDLKGSVKGLIVNGFKDIIWLN